MADKVALISLGCAKNLVNSEQMLYLLSEAGFDLVGNPDGADVVVVNTCGFIDSAKSEAIDVILNMAELKESGSLKKIIVTGCLSQRYRDEIERELPEVDAMLGVGSFGEIVTAVKKALAGEPAALFGDMNAPVETTWRCVTTGPSWAYLRIAEGCDNRCAYCAIPDIRGRFRSMPEEAVLDEARRLAESGVKELIIIAQDITRYGTDICGRPALAPLLEKLCGIDGIQWIRLHYLYPDEITEELINVAAREEKILKYFDIPIQHINNDILRRMNRRGTGDEIRVLFEKLRRRIPGAVLRTSLITGLPGEGEDEFEELCEFLREARIERVGVFAFSPEEGTPAAQMTDRVDEETAQRRADLIMQLQSGIMDEFYAGRVGTTLRVLVEAYDEETGCMVGRSAADSPDIDGKVYFEGEAEPGRFADVEILSVIDGELFGRAVRFEAERTL